MSKKLSQISMFPQGDDLPLFSGTAQAGQVNPYRPKVQPKAAQDTLPVAPLADDAPIYIKSFFGGEPELFKPVGRGAYPYDCRSKDKHPNSMVYVSDTGGWVAEHQLQADGLGVYWIKP